jgi:hypothetical protein
MLVRLANICNKFDDLGLHEISAKITNVMIKLSENEDNEEEHDDHEDHDKIDVNDIAKELESAMNSIEKILSRMKRKNDSVKYSADIHKNCDSMLDLVKSSAKNENKTLNKPFRTPGGPKKFSVYVKNDKGNVIKVNFGDPGLSIKRENPERRKNYRARHNCDNPGPKYKANYWSCRNWEAGRSVTDNLKGK